MKKTILIAPFNGPLAAPVAAAARAAGWTLALALARADRIAAAEPADRENGDSFTLSYNPASFVSVAALIQEACNALGEIDAAVLIADPSAVRADFASGKPGELGAAVEEQCAGPLYLARILVRRFEARKAGRLVLVAPERPRDAAPGPLAALAAGAFEGLGSGLFASAEGAPWSAVGVMDAGGLPERTADFVLGLLDERRQSKTGRWIRFTGKGGIFGGA